MRIRSQHALLKALRKQDPRALEAAIDEFGGYVMAVALHTLGSRGSRQDAEEVASDTFMALWRSAPGLRADSRLKPWLAVVARNTTLKRLRSLKPTQSLDEPLMQAALEAAIEARAAAEGRAGELGDFADGLLDAMSEPLAAFVRPAGQRDGGAQGQPEDSVQHQTDGEPFERLPEHLLAGLNATDRELLRRRYCEEQSISTIAQQTELSQPAVKSRLYRGRRLLRERLGQRGGLGNPKECRG